MDTFVYRIASLRGDQDGLFPLLEDLDGMGSEGWRLVKLEKSPDRGSKGFFGLFEQRIPSTSTT